jgi:hypothetical protein
MRDGKPVPGCNIKIDISIPPGVDDCRFSCVPDDIRDMSKTPGKNPFKQHRFTLRVDVYPLH